MSETIITTVAQGVLYAFLCPQLFSAEIVILDDNKKSDLVLKFQNGAKNYFLVTPFLGRRRKFESPISRLRKVVEGFLKKQNVWK